MNNGGRNGWFPALGVAAMLAVGFVPARAGVSEAWISTQVKTLLMSSQRVAGFPIDVDTDGGRVTLHGSVSENDQKAEVEPTQTSRRWRGLSPRRRGAAGCTES